MTAVYIDQPALQNQVLHNIATCAWYGVQYNVIMAYSSELSVTLVIEQFPSKYPLGVMPLACTCI